MWLAFISEDGLVEETLLLLVCLLYLAPSPTAARGRRRHSTPRGSFLSKASVVIEDASVSL